MDFFNTILLSVICIMFPLLLYLIYLTYLNAKNENLKYEEVVFELALITGLFLTIELTKGVRTNYSIVLLNIPILFSYLRGKRGIGIILSIILGIYYITSFKYNAYMVIFEYLVYYIFFLIESNKNTTTLRNISWFTIIKTFFFSFFIYYFNPNITFMDAFNNIFVAILVFYVCSILCYKLLSKSEDVINLNNSLKELEKEKPLRNSLFKLTHEIKNPIAVCKGYLNMIDLSNRKNSQRYIEVIKGEVERTLVIMDDFLDYTKIKVDKNIMDINYLLEDTLGSMSSLFNSKNILTKFKIGDDEVFINGDYNRLKQVLVNVIKNSIESKKEDEKLKLTITTNQEGNNYRITIKDNGIGMDKEELNNIGKAFYTTKVKGTGLGVMLSKEIIELHDGNLIYSSNKNEGTCVDIILPTIEI